MRALPSILAGVWLFALPACDKPAPATAKSAARTAPLLTGDPARGRRIFSSLGCATCHAISGTSPQGPTLANYWMTIRKLEDGREVIADETYTRRALLEPQVDVFPGYPAPMPGIRGMISDEQLNDLIAYIKSLSNP